MSWRFKQRPAPKERHASFLSRNSARRVSESLDASYMPGAGKRVWSHWRL
jgi:hypothetical protein